MRKFSRLHKNLDHRFILPLVILGVCWLPMTVQAAGGSHKTLTELIAGAPLVVQIPGRNLLLQGADNLSIFRNGLLDDEVRFESGNVVKLEEYSVGQARIVVLMGYISPGGFAYNCEHWESGHLIINGYDCQLFNNQLYPLWYKQYDVDLKKRQWRVLWIHKIDANSWRVDDRGYLPAVRSYVPMDDFVWRVIMDFVPPNVISELSED